MSILCNLSKMEEGKSHHHHHHLFQDSWFQYEDNLKSNKIDHIDEADDDERCGQSSSATSSIGEDSDASNGSSMTSSDTLDDASSLNSSSSSNSSRALYDLSEIMDQLPIKRGLSQFYKGKSESFTSLSRVTSIEDLVKKAAAATPYRRNLKASKSCGTGLHSYKQYTLPKATISKKSSRGGVSHSSFPSKRGGFMNSKPPLTPLHQNLGC